MFNRVVVPLDGSVLSERALGPARLLAAHDQAELLLVRVAVPEKMLLLADPSLGAPYAEQLLEARREAERYLATVRTACAAADVPVQVAVAEGEVAGTLVDTAREAGAGFVVMSSHGYTGMRRWLLGSVAEKVLDAAPCPVWVVRAPAPPRQVLLTLDGSPRAEEVLGPAVTVARCFDARLTLLRVVPDIAAGDIRALDECERGMGRRWADEMREDAAAYLELVAGRFRGEGLAVQTAVRSGPAAEAILAYAEQNAVDLVAMTTHGRTGLRRWLYGSVTHKVLDQLPVSMLVARSAARDLG